MPNTPQRGSQAAKQGTTPSRTEVPADLPAEFLLADEMGWHAAGSTRPNPPVGCVIVGAAGEILGRGATEPAGGRHAEVVALHAAGARAAGATAYVTLEPCNHTGRTGPCAEALIAAGIAEVHYLFADPGRTEGGGGERLRAAGVTVTGPYLEPFHLGEHRFSVEAWLRAAHLGRPHVTLKFASTLNGLAAATDRTSQWITGVPARADVHADRQYREAILVGTGTVLADDPQLTARPGGAEGPRQPLRFALGQRELPANARLLQAGTHAPAGQHLATRDLHAALAELRRQGISDVLVEGGPELAGSFLAHGLVDEIRAYLAPAWLPRGLPALGAGGIGSTSITDLQRFATRSVQRIGEDILWLAQRQTGD